MATLKLVIFDCDGVLFDSKDANRQYYNHLLDRFHRPAMTEDEVDYVHMHNVKDSVKHIFRHYPLDLAKVDHYRQELDYTPFLKYMIMEPDLPAFLNFLKPKHEVAISTNRTTTMPAVLKQSGLNDYFTKVVTALDVKNPKPHPEALENILSYFNYSVEEAIYIGDSSIDQQHAAAIGMRLIAFRNPKLEADFHIDNFTEAMALPIFSGN